LLAKSETLRNKADALSAAQTLKIHADNPSCVTFSVLPSKSAAQPWTWHATTNNNRILIASSETYRDRSGAQNAIDSIKRNAPSAEIVDLTRSAAVSR
jgi:uncharacterized protein YegP (UPF0339 family)